ncbi:MAG: GGDEF domain-containing protein [Syntrophales bacterium LBB04]|nr:GGDEF domain-containing protein [Syntrophales bacterium LBB04]
MKPLKRPVQSPPKIQPPATMHEFLQNIIKKEKTRGGKLLSKKDQPEMFFILTEDIPAETLAELLNLGKGLTVKPKDNLLKRLLKLEKEYHHIKELSLTDELTGLNNKRFFNRQLKIEIARTKRTGQPFCLMFIDLDNFKSINDTLGHTKGDEFLVNLCRLICQKIRPTDFACRYGGDEFTIIMPATSLVDGISIAQRWHALIKQVASQMKTNVSSSIGIDEFDVYSVLSAEEFLNKVDKELYIAKNTGKNKVSYPELLRDGKVDERSVTPAEKDVLYKTFVQLKQKRKHLSAKE